MIHGLFEWPTQAPPWKYSPFPLHLFPNRSSCHGKIELEYCSNAYSSARKRFRPQWPYL